MTEVEEPEPTLRQVTDQLLEAIHLNTTLLTGKIEVKINVGVLWHGLQNPRGHVRKIQDQVSHLKDTTTPTVY